MSQWYDGFNLINPNQPSEASEVPLSLPPANEVWGKVIFLHLSVILFTGGCVFPYADTPYPRILWDTVNKRAVRILLECILLASHEHCNHWPYL